MIKIKERLNNFLSNILKKNDTHVGKYFFKISKKRL